jgi:hypothetical protein
MGAQSIFPLKTAIQMRGFGGIPRIPIGYNCRMDFFFPEDDLQRMTPEETHITSLAADPYPDGERVRVNIEMTPFQKRPYIEVVLTDKSNEEVATASIVEPMGWKLEFTMHLRGAKGSPFQIEARLFYPDGPQAEPVTQTFEISSAG